MDWLRKRRALPLVVAIASVGLMLAATGCDDDDDDFFHRRDRLEAALLPVINVDASGHVIFEEDEGTSDDRLDIEVEIDADDFGFLGIDTDDGFEDEDVVVEIGNGGTVFFDDRLDFTEDRRVGGEGDIVFELDLDGFDVPNLEEGDVVEIFVNDNLTLRGTLDED